MNITEVRIFLTTQPGPTKAFASVTFDDAFCGQGFKGSRWQKGLVCIHASP